MTNTRTAQIAATATAAPEAAFCKILIPVVFNYGMRSEFRLLPGSVVEWEPEDGNLVRIRACGSSKVIHIEDATPVEWDEVDEMWVEEI